MEKTGVLDTLTRDQQVALVTIYPSILHYIQNQDPESMKIAIMRDPESIKYMKFQDPQLVSLALEYDPNVIFHIREPRFEDLKKVIESCPKLAEKLPNLPGELQIEAFWLDPTVSISNPTAEYLDFMDNEKKKKDGERYCVIS